MCSDNNIRRSFHSSDYCFNSGPFLSQDQFDEFVTPYLVQAIAAQRQMGYYVIKHTDGNIMPILDRLLDPAETRRPQFGTGGGWTTR